MPRREGGGAGAGDATASVQDGATRPLAAYFTPLQQRVLLEAFRDLEGAGSYDVARYLAHLSNDTPVKRGQTRQALAARGLLVLRGREPHLTAKGHRLALRLLQEELARRLEAARELVTT